MSTQNSQQKSDEENKIIMTATKQQKLATIFRWINGGCGLALITNGILRYIFFAALISEPWTIFQPGYMIMFGIVIFGAELNLVFILSRISFMCSYIGRGFLDIFVATICSSYLGGSGLNVLAIVITIFLFVVGLMFLCFHFTGLELILPPKVSELQSNKSSTSTNNSSNLDNSQNLGRGLNENASDPQSVYSNGQI
ncbi:hypothetical protein ABPG72_019297 [Tetrahymena utriculariae]